MPPGHDGPRPSGGVGGTRTGVKCLHAHFAWYLAGGRDPVGRWVARELAGELAGPVGAIDCGTNSTSLLICGRDGETLEREMTITRLGENVDKTRSLAPAAIARTLDGAATVPRAPRRARCRRGASRGDLSGEGRGQCRGVLLRGRLGPRRAARAPERRGGGRLSYAGRRPVSISDVSISSSSTSVGARPSSSPPASGRAEIAVVSVDVGCVRVTGALLQDRPADRWPSSSPRGSSSARSRSARRSRSPAPRRSDRDGRCRRNRVDAHQSRPRSRAL